MAEQVPATTLTVRLHQVITALVAVMYVVVLYQIITDRAALQGLDWQLQLLMAAAAANSLTAQARQLSWQYVLAAAAFAAVLGSLAHVLSQDSGIPFGPFEFGPNAGALVARLPLIVPVIWIVVFFNSRGVGRLIMRPWRKVKTYGFWLIGITAVLAMLFDLGMDPFLGYLNHYWLWSATRLPLTWEGAPLINFPGWLFVTLLILAFSTPVLIKKKPGQKNASDYHPLCLWVGGLALFAVACGVHGLWVPLLTDVVVMAAALVPAVHGGRW